MINKKLHKRTKTIRKKTNDQKQQTKSNEIESKNVF
jgi:hypothetical protein